MKYQPLTDKQIEILDEIQEVRTMFAQNGVDRTGKRNTLRDALATPNFPSAFKRVIEEVIIDAIEPHLVGSLLLDKIYAEPNRSDIRLRTYGAIDIGDIAIAEGMEYPEFIMSEGPGLQTVASGKYGLKLRITDEMLNNSQWDILGHHVRKLGQAMARAKEANIFRMIAEAGVAVFDNQNPNTSLYGRTTGRDISGAGNGSFTADDMYDMYAFLVQGGFKPNVLLVHPLAWATFTKDPVLREYALKNGNLSNWFTSMPQEHIKTGEVVRQIWKDFTRAAGPTAFNPTDDEYAGTVDSPVILPAYFPGTDLKIITSPYVPFDPVNKTCSILMVDTNELGAICVFEDPTMEEWREHERDMNLIKIRERYGLALYNEGNSIAVARNISIEPNEIALPPQAIVSNLPRIQRK